MYDSASAPSGLFAQLVEKRMIVWVSSYASLKPNSTCFASRSIAAFSMTQKT